MILMKILISMLNCKDINRICVYYLYSSFFENLSLIVTRIAALYFNSCFRNSILCHLAIAMPNLGCEFINFDSPDGGAHVHGSVLHIGERCLWGNYYG